MKEHYPVPGGRHLPVSGQPSGTNQPSSPTANKSPGEAAAPGEEGGEGGDKQLSKSGEPGPPKFPGGHWQDVVVFLAIIGIAAVLVLVGRMSGPDLAAYGAVVTSIHAAWRSQRRSLRSYPRCPDSNAAEGSSSPRRVGRLSLLSRRVEHPGNSHNRHHPIEESRTHYVIGWGIT